jgi:hypothetical protein
VQTEQLDAPSRPVCGDKNRLFYGDNLDVLRQRIADENVNLVDLDPLFNSNARDNVLFADKTGKRAAAEIQGFEDTACSAVDSRARVAVTPRDCDRVLRRKNTRSEIAVVSLSEELSPASVRAESCQWNAHSSGSTSNKSWRALRPCPREDRVARRRVHVGRGGRYRTRTYDLVRVKHAL